MLALKGGVSMAGLMIQRSPRQVTAGPVASGIRIREGGRERSVSKRRAMLKALVAKGLKGDARAAGLVFALVAKHLDLPGSDAPDQPLAAEDRALLDAFVQRQVKPQPTPDDLEPNATETSDVG